MHALEMEEVESLVGARLAKKKKGNQNDMMAAVLTKRSFLTRLVIGAVLLGLVIMIFGRGGSKSANFDNDFNIDAAQPAGNHASTPAPVASNPLPEYVTPPVATLVTTPVKPVPSSSSSGASDVKFVYSNLATIVPLVDAHPPLDDKKKTELGEKWGHWHFWDGDEDTRPTNDYCADYPNRDIPGDQFPEDAWQADAVFVNHYLNDADQLITRSMEAIFTEYGHAKPLNSVGLAERMKMFHWDKPDLSGPGPFAPPEKYARQGLRDNGGWTTKRSFDGLVRRLLHAMMTSDTFTVVMAGHSAAAGQGNHFRQSYMMQFHKTMYPIFARLGVKLITRSIAQGGLGTLQASMGSGSIYGDEVDLLLWDSGMTESGNLDHIDLFFRQGLIGGNRVPVLWGGDFDLLQTLHEHADADVGEFGNAMYGIREVTSEEQAEKIPWAARYLKCSQDAKSLCDDQPRFCSKCWIDRDDGVTPEQSQRDSPRGQVKWHPGWRWHQLQGRALAFSLMEALQAAVNKWSDGVMGGPPLDDSLWHITNYYENIRNKVKSLDASLGKCHDIKSKLPARMCSIPMKARTQYTPRANFHETSLTSIIKPTSDGYVPKNEKKALYDGPDAHNSCFDMPEGTIDVFDIISGRRHLKGLESSVADGITEGGSPIPAHSAVNRSLASLEAGKGWQVFDEPQGLCDGTYNTVCARQTDTECVLYGHHDARGAVIGNEYAGWLVMNLKDLVAGIIVVKLHTWHYDSENTATAGWTTVNNENNGRRLGKSYQEDKYTGIESDESSRYYEANESGERVLMRSYDTPDLPDEFIFEYSINGVVTSLSKTEFLEKKQQLQRVVETVTLLDDAGFTSEAKDVEVAIRLRGCGRKCTFGVSHIYWA